MFWKEDSSQINTYILTELRELRRGVEARDDSLRGEITAIRDAVGALSTSVSQSHNNVEGMREELNDVKQAVAVIDTDFRAMQTSIQVTNEKNKAAWDGPKRIFAAVVTISILPPFILGVVQLWPLVAEILK